MSTKSTPGPWKRERGFARNVLAEDGGVVATANAVCFGVSQAHANARLIAAAPDLLDFARWVLSINCGAAINKRAREVIAKATGEKQ